MAPRTEWWLLRCIGALLAAFLALPIIALFATASLSDVALGLRHPLVWPALRLSAFTTAVTLLLVIALGTPLAWVLARPSGRGARARETLIKRPIVKPPTVAGVAMVLPATPSTTSV